MTSAESPSPAGAELTNTREDTKNSLQASCPHPVWVAHVKGGEPLSVSICQLCRAINWEELRADFEKAAYHPWLGLATTKLLLEEIAARGQTEPHYVELGGEMYMGARSLMERLPGSMLEYRTSDKEWTDKAPG